MTRDATLTDAVALRDSINAFFENIGKTDSTITLRRMQQRLQDPNIVTVIDDGAGSCQIKCDPLLKECEIDPLIGIPPYSVATLQPILQDALEAVRQRFDSADWRVWGWFPGSADGGATESRIWHEQFPASRIVKEPGGRVIIEATLGDITSGVRV